VEIRVAENADDGDVTALLASSARPFALRLHYINLALPPFWASALTNKNNMSEDTTSGEPTVASTETISAPPAAAPSFGNSRGSGLARGKRPSAPAPAAATDKNAATGAYQPTSIQVVNHQTEYKNPFAPEPAPVAVVETPAQIEQPVAFVPVEQSAPETTPPVAFVAPVAAQAPVETFTPTPKAVVEPKAELKILPPEENARPAQSWEIGGQSDKPATSANPRREGRADFRPTRREDRPARNDQPARTDDRPARSEQPQDPRNEFRPREPRREPSGERREQFGERKEQFGERREQRTFQPKPTPAVVEAKKSGFLGWLKGLFAGDTAEKTVATPAPRQDERSGEGRRYEGGNRGGNRGGQPHRGGRGRGGYRGDYRGENRGPQQFGSGPEGQSQNQGGPEQQGQGGEQRRFDGGNNGGGRRHHRGGRGRFRGDNRGGGENRGDSNGPTS